MSSYDLSTHLYSSGPVPGVNLQISQNRAVLDDIKGVLDEIQLHEVGGRTTHKRAVTCL